MPAVTVYQDLDVRADLVTHSRDQLHAVIFRLRGQLACQVSVPLFRVVGVPGVGLERGLPRFDDGTGVLHGLFDGGAVLRVAVDRYRVTDRAAEKLVDGQSLDFAPDVPECNVDPADGVRARAARPHVCEGPEDLVPDAFDLRRVTPDQKVVQLADDRTHSPVGDVGRACDLAPSGDPLVGRHLDEHVLALPRVAVLGRLELRSRTANEPRCDPGDLQALTPF